ncbi:MAG: hypothetical protein R3B06_18845 [Kofleriaceae bacterium]
MTATVLVVIDSGDPAVVDEAWRAAVGLTLRGARVMVATRPGAAPGTAAAARARATLALFGHGVDADADAVDADVVEQWRDGADRPGRPADRADPTVHLVRPGRAVGALGPGDRVLQLGDPADVDYAELLAAIAAAPVRVW